jgi:hypothetical protein
MKRKLENDNNDVLENNTLLEFMMEQDEAKRA